jgi:hypothetical protein
MNKLKSVKAIVTGVIGSNVRAADGWHFLRTAVGEFRGLLQMLDKAVMEFEGRLADLEIEAAGQAGAESSNSQPARKRSARTKGKTTTAMPEKTGRGKSARSTTGSR